MVDQMGLAARALLNHIGPLRCLRIETIKSVIHKTWLSIQLAHIAVNVFSFLLYFSREREIWRDRGREREGTNKTPRYLFHYTVSATRSECSGHSLLLVPNELHFIFFFIFGGVFGYTIFSVAGIPVGRCQQQFSEFSARISWISCFAGEFAENISWISHMRWNTHTDTLYVLSERAR